MPDLQTVAVVAGVAAVSSALSVVATSYLLPLWQARCSSTSSAVRNTGYSRARTPAPSELSTPAPNALFSPVDKQKRPDPYDTRARSSYLSWDDYFMALAHLSAERSKDPNKQVGACIVNDKNIILSIGYNGFPRGCSDTSLPWAKKAQSGSILDTKYPYVVHAEANALLNKNQAIVTGARIYVTLFPCNECAKLLIQAGITEVIYAEAKLEPTGQRPATMERAAAADEAADLLEATAAAAQGAAGHDATASSSATANSSKACNCCADECVSSTSGRQEAGPSASQQQRKQQPNVPGQQSAASAPDKKFGVGASEDVDASYAASQRLLTLAGVKLRQHALKRNIQLGPG